MDKLTLTRFAYTDIGTFGKITVDGQTLYTVERPWINNAPTISCIPEGSYACQPRWYIRRGYDAVEVTDVPNRTHILFHIGNTMNDSAGCILVNSSLGFVHNMWAGIGSKVAFNTFMQTYGNTNFTLKIKQYKPTKGTNKFTV